MEYRITRPPLSHHWTTTGQTLCWTAGARHHRATVPDRTGPPDFWTTGPPADTTTGPTENANGDGISGDGASVRHFILKKIGQRWRLSVRGRLELGKTQRCRHCYDAVRGAERHLSDALGVRRPLAFAGPQSFFASKHARLRRVSATATFYCGRHQRERIVIPTRSQPWMRGLAHIANNYETEFLEARSGDASIPIIVMFSCVL